MVKSEEPETSAFQDSLKPPYRCFWHAHAIGKSVTGKTVDEIVPAMQMELRDIMPQIRIAGIGPLIETVNDIVIHLSSDMLTTLKKKFPEVGLECDEFVEVLMVALCAENPKLQTEEQAILLVALLHDLFAQMDVDGEGTLHLFQ
jgi:hypothetical protein